MDINDLRSISTLLAFISFVGVVVWAYSANRKQAFDEAANLPLDDEKPAAGAGGAGQQNN